MMYSQPYSFAHETEFKHWAYSKGNGLIQEQVLWAEQAFGPVNVDWMYNVVRFKFKHQKHLELFLLKWK